MLLAAHWLETFGLHTERELSKRDAVKGVSPLLVRNRGHGVPRKLAPQPDYGARNHSTGWIGNGAADSTNPRIGGSGQKRDGGNQNQDCITNLQ